MTEAQAFFKPVEMEVICDEVDDPEELCQIYIDADIDGLSFLYVLAIKEDDSKGVANFVRAETVYDYEDKENTMDRDAVIHDDGGQTLRLRRIGNNLDPIRLTYRKKAYEEAQSFVFSIDEVQDLDQRDSSGHDTSGHYTMSVPQ